MKIREKHIYNLLEFIREENRINDSVFEQFVEFKNAAIPVLIQELKELKSKYDWSTIGLLLRRIGKDAFDPLIELLLHQDKEISRRAAWALNGFGEVAVEKILSNFAHESPTVRSQMATIIQYVKGGVKESVPYLIQLLGDNDSYVQQRAIWALREQGPRIVEPLIQARLYGDKRKRKAALVALLELYPEKVPEADIKLIRRLDKLVSRKDRPIPFDEISWIAIPKIEIEELMKICKLEDPQIVPFTKGLDAVICDYHDNTPNIYAPMTRVYISPVFEDKWIFIVGGIFAVSDEESQIEVNQLLNILSNKTGEAYCFTSQTRMGWYSWTISKEGKVIREHLGEDCVINRGQKTLPEMDINFDEQGYWGEYVFKIAKYYSINPLDITAETKFEGNGYLAKTEYGSKHGMPRRALAYWWNTKNKLNVR